ncbi:hypothetical protein [Desulfosporosinus acidiphilus]|uniref:hypothetical protein n=1 Tax=Desulfosporosinus acidiphilus TaxID=885581 RepID=UPI001A9A34EE|nr:hypothetical protein [Desulfosporosinus acidiphilus]
MDMDTQVTGGMAVILVMVGVIWDTPVLGGIIVTLGADTVIPTVGVIITAGN